MTTSRLFYENWPVDTTEVKRLYLLPGVVGSERQLGIVCDVDLDGALSLEPAYVPALNFELLASFTESLHSVLFGVSFPRTPFTMWIVIVCNEQLDIQFMKRCVDNECQPLNAQDVLDKNLPIVVKFLLSKNKSKDLYSVNSAIHKHPDLVTMPVDGFRKTQPSSSMNVSRFYEREYSADCSSNAFVLVGSMGSPFASQKNKGEINTSLKSCVLLVSDYVVLHPFDEVKELIAKLPQLLFNLETGILAKKVTRSIFLGLPYNLIDQSQSANKSLLDKFLPHANLLPYPSKAITLVSFALTTPSSQVKPNYEVLEWLGDSVWRLVCATHMNSETSLFNYKNKFNTYMSNEYLWSKLNDSAFYIGEKCILSGCVSLRNPLTARSKIGNYRIVADVAEALIAVGYLCFGFAGAVTVTKNLSLIDKGAEYNTHPYDAQFQFNVLKPAISRFQISKKVLFDRDIYSTSVGVMNEIRSTAIRKLPGGFSNVELPTSLDDI